MAKAARAAAAEKAREIRLIGNSIERQRADPVVRIRVEGFVLTGAKCAVSIPFVHMKYVFLFSSVEYMRELVGVLGKRSSRGNGLLNKLRNAATPLLRKFAVSDSLVEKYTLLQRNYQNTIKTISESCNKAWFAAISKKLYNPRTVNREELTEIYVNAVANWRMREIKHYVYATLSNYRLFSELIDKTINRIANHIGRGTGDTYVVWNFNRLLYYNLNIYNTVNITDICQILLNDTEDLLLSCSRVHITQEVLDKLESLAKLVIGIYESGRRITEEDLRTHADQEDPYIENSIHAACFYENYVYPKSGTDIKLRAEYIRQKMCVIRNAIAASKLVPTLEEQATKFVLVRFVGHQISPEATVHLLSEMGIPKVVVTAMMNSRYGCKASTYIYTAGEIENLQKKGREMSPPPIALNRALPIWIRR